MEDHILKQYYCKKCDHIHTKGSKVFDNHIDFRNAPYENILDLSVIGCSKNIFKKVQKIMTMDYINQHCGHQARQQCIKIMKRAYEFIFDEIKKYEARTNDVKKNNVIDIMLDEEV